MHGVPSSWPELYFARFFYMFPRSGILTALVEKLVNRYGFLEDLGGCFGEAFCEVWGAMLDRRWLEGT